MVTGLKTQELAKFYTASDNFWTGTGIIITDILDEIIEIANGQVR